MFGDSKKFRKSCPAKGPYFNYIGTRGTSILGEVCNVEISGVTQQLLCSKSHDFLALFALAHSKINQIAKFLNDDVRNHLNLLCEPLDIQQKVIRLYTWQHLSLLSRHFLY